jgi:hypothetical protein
VVKVFDIVGIVEYSIENVEETKEIVGIRIVEIHIVEIHIAEIHIAEIHIVEIHIVEIHIVEIHIVEIHIVEIHIVEIEEHFDAVFFFFSFVSPLVPFLLIFPIFNNIFVFYSRISYFSLREKFLFLIV